MKNLTYFVLTLSGFLFQLSSFAQGNLLVIPRRIVFEGPKKTQEINLANTGIDTARFVISVVQYKMTEDGNFETITQPDSGQYFADKNFRFFPQNVVLAPNESQTVKVQITNSGNLQPGEYRSHLYFRSVQNNNPAAELTQTKEEKNISIHLVPVFGVTIPVIIRTGATSSDVSIKDPVFSFDSNGNLELKMILNRTGNISTYGNLKINHISSQGKITEVGIAKGFAIYTPNKTRKFVMALDKSKNVNFHDGRLQIIYSSPSDTKYVKYAETEISLF